jgi:hypothetical protein
MKKISIGILVLLLVISMYYDLRNLIDNYTVDGTVWISDGIMFNVSLIVVKFVSIVVLLKFPMTLIKAKNSRKKIKE